MTSMTAPSSSQQCCTTLGRKSSQQLPADIVRWESNQVSKLPDASDYSTSASQHNISSFQSSSRLCRRSRSREGGSEIQLISNTVFTLYWVLLVGQVSLSSRAHPMRGLTARLRSSSGSSCWLVALPLEGCTLRKAVCRTHLACKYDSATAVQPSAQSDFKLA